MVTSVESIQMIPTVCLGKVVRIHRDWLSGSPDFEVMSSDIS